MDDLLYSLYFFYKYLAFGAEFDNQGNVSLLHVANLIHAAIRSSINLFADTVPFFQDDSFNSLILRAVEETDAVILHYLFLIYHTRL